MIVDVFVRVDGHLWNHGAPRVGWEGLTDAVVCSRIAMPSDLSPTSALAPAKEEKRRHLTPSEIFIS